MSNEGTLDRALLDRHPLPAVVEGDKDSKGRILVVAGSREVPGAALLTATAAMRAGAGKLRIASPASLALPLGIAMPEAAVSALDEDGDGGFGHGAADDLRGLSGEADAVVAGPGLKGNDHCAALANALLEAAPAVVLDAALLHALEPLHRRALDRDLPPVLLPHSGELASLLECEEAEIERDPLGCGRKAAQLYAAVVLVKGAQSHVVHPDGRAFFYPGGGAGLGVSGSGDTLAGIVGGLLARGAEPLTALLWGTWLHGEAGKALAKRVGPLGFLARQIAEEVPRLLPAR